MSSVGNTSLPVQLTQTSGYHDQQSRTAPSSLYQGTAIGSDVHPAQNTSSDLSLESENLGFADLPNRPATIGNYGASEAANTSPFGITGIPLQPMNIQVNTSQSIISVPSTFSGSGTDVALMSEGSDTLLSKAPMSARERLQPDGRDGPDVLAAPKTVQVVPSLVSYPLSAGSSSDNTPGPQPSVGNSDLDSSKSSNISQVGQLLVGDAAQSSPYSTSQISGSIPVTSGALGMSLHSNNSVGLPLSNVMDNSSLGIGSQLPNGMGMEDSNQLGSKSSVNSSLQSNFSPEQVKGSQVTSLPRQHGASLTEDQSAMTHTTNATPIANTSWLSGGVSPTSQALIELPTGPPNQGMGSFAQNEIRDAVMQRIDAHTQITDFGSKEEPKIPTETSFSWSKPTDISGTYGDLDARFVRNGQVAQLGNIPPIPARSYHSLPDTQGFIPTTTQAIATSFGPMAQGDRQTSFNRHTIFSSQVDRQATHSELPGSYNAYSYTTARSFPSSTLTGKSAEEVNGRVATHSSAQNVISRSSVLEDPGRSRTQKDVFSRPSALDHIKSGLLNSEEDEQSPVSKLLGPKFKATQDYLNKLRNERLEASSFKSTGSSDSESRVPLESHREKPFDNSLRQRDFSKEVSSKFSTSSLSNNSYERRLESKQAWSVNSSDLLDSRSDRMGKDKDESLKQQSLSFEHETMSKGKDISTSFYTRDVHSTSYSPYDKTTPSTASTDRNSAKDSYLKYSQVNSFPTGKKEGVHGLQDSLSRYETPLSSLQTDEKAWAQDVGRNAVNKRTLYSTESISLMSSHDEAEDTDDLLSYEAVLEGDIKYIRRLKDGKQESKPQETSSERHFHSSSVNSKSSLTPQITPGQGELSSVNGSVDRDPLTRFPMSVGSSGSDFPSIEEETKRFHLSLGAGLVSPVVVSENEKGSPEEHSYDDDDDVQLSSDGIEIEDIEEQEEQEEVLHPSVRESPTTDSSSSSTYQPYIPIAVRKSASAERDSEVTGNSSSTYGVYDIRNSSGPGSTNRRRKAMGLTPIPGRVSKPINGVVYVTPESSPMHSSMQEDVSTDEKSSKDDTLTSQSRNKSKSDLQDKHSTSHRCSSKETHRTGSRDRNSSRHSAEDRELHKKKPSRDKDESFRSRSRGSSFEEAKVIDDYIGGRKLVQHGKNRNAKSRSKDETHSDESPSLKEYSTSTKNADLNQMWERFQESLRSSPRYTRTDSVSSHLSRLSALLSKPLDTAATSSETEFDGERFRKPRSHSYASSSSEVSTESDQLYNEYPKSSSLSRQIKLRKLLETVNVADVPTFPRLRHRDTTTTTTTTSSTMSDTSFSEAPESRNTSHVTLPRSNRGLRKVSKTPVLVPSSQSRRPTEHDTSGPKCICAIHKEKPAEPVRAGPVVKDKQHIQRPRTMDAAVNVPSPKTPRRVRKKEGFVDVGVQTTRDSDEELYRQNVHTKGRSKKHHKDATKLERVNSDKATATGASTPKRKDRHIASQNSPIQKHVRSLDSSLRSPEDLHNTTQEDSRLENTSKKEKSRSRQHKDRLLASQNSSVAKSNSESQHSPSGPSWFYPMTNRHYSHPARSSSVAIKHSKPSFQTSVVMPDRLRFDEHTTKAFSPPAAAPSTSMQKLSLQEAFCFAKPDFVKRSRARLSRIDYNRTVRETGETKTKGEERVSKMEIPAAKPSVSKQIVNPKTGMDNEG